MCYFHDLTQYIVRKLIILVLYTLWTSLVAHIVKHLPTMQETRVQSLGWEDPLEREWHPTPVSCLKNSMDRRVWWAIVHGVAKRWTRLSDHHLYFSSVMFFPILELSERNHTFEFFTRYRHL